MAELLPLLLATAGEHQGELLASAEASHLVIHAKVNLPPLQAGWTLAFVNDAGSHQLHTFSSQLDWQLSSADQGATG